MGTVFSPTLFTYRAPKTDKTGETYSSVENRVQYLPPNSADFSSQKNLYIQQLRDRKNTKRWKNGNEHLASLLSSTNK